MTPPKYITQTYQPLNDRLKAQGVRLVAVSKTKTVAEIMTLYQAGQRDFGENKVQELLQKKALLPDDICWHHIGHLQTNKVKYIAPFISLIQSVDSLRLLQEIDKQAALNGRIIDCLLQIHIAQEETKFGLTPAEAADLPANDAYRALQNVRIVGLMGMASFTENTGQIRNEFGQLRQLFDMLKNTCFAKKTYFKELSMGMSSDYAIAVEQGATIVRIGSLLFGERP